MVACYDTILKFRPQREGRKCYMLPFTPRERQALVFLSFVLIAGLSFKLIFGSLPIVERAVRVLDEPQYRPKVDINLAPYNELIAVPFIGPSAAGKIVRARKAKGRINGPAGLVAVLGRTPAEIERVRPYLEWGKE